MSIWPRRTSASEALTEAKLNAEVLDQAQRNPRTLTIRGEGFNGRSFTASTIIRVEDVGNLQHIIDECEAAARSQIDASTVTVEVR